MPGLAGKFKQLDGFASSFEAGCKMDTIGYISFPKSAPSEHQLTAPRLEFHYANIDGNTVSLAQVCSQLAPHAGYPYILLAIDTRKSYALFGDES